MSEDQHLEDASIKDVLLGGNYVSSEDMSKAEVAADKTGVSLVEYLMKQDLLTRDLLGQALAESKGVQYVDLRQEKIDIEVLQLIPELVSRSKKVIAIRNEGEELVIGMVDPGDVVTKNFVAKRAAMPVKVFFVMEEDLREALESYQASLGEEFGSLMAQLQDTSLTREQRDEVTVQVVDMLLQYGYQNKASDIHIEPYSNKVGVRFRIDGVMHDVLDIPKALSELILARLKIMARLRTDEHRAAQDGKLRFEVQEENASEKGEKVDVRVSVVPVTEGENVVMRLLSSKNRQFTLQSLGLSESDMAKVNKAIANPHGMILVTGPTGSGKTTTLYGVMKILNTREVHVSTIEDPVEYDVEGISQIQVNTKTGLTFAKGLRSIVRQDPDIIMVGEIRDEETADIAVNSALTGHLVLSTLHTNDAPTTLPRLLDMGVEPFLVSSTVNVVIAQRLVRKIHQKCRVSYTPSEKELAAMSPELRASLTEDGGKSLRFYRGAGCKLDGGTGYMGRVGVFEVLELTEDLKKLIVDRASSDELMNAAREAGMKTMYADGMDKVKKGITTLEEVMRVAME